MNFIPINAFGVTDVDRQLFISDISTVSTITDRDNLIAQEGDIAKVTANNITYVFDGAQWINLVETSGTVTSVNSINPVGGNVSLTTQNVPENTNLYYTNQRVLDYIKTILTTSGDAIYRDNANNLVRLPLGTNNQILISDGVKPTYSNLSTIGGITSINNQAGTNGNIIITTTHINEGVNLYWTQARFDNRLGQFYQNNGDLLIRKALNDLSALSIGTTGQFLRVNNGLPAWETVNFSTNLSNLGDVALANLQNNQLLQYNNGLWENKTVTYSSTLAGCTDVQFGILSDQDIIRYDNASSKFKNYSLTLKNNLSELNDVNIVTVAQDNFLRFNNGKWENRVVNFSTRLDQLQDTNIVGLADRNYISYNADTQKWLNGSIIVNDISWAQSNTGVKIANTAVLGGVLKTLVAGTNISIDGTSNTTITISSTAGGANNLSELDDCSITTPTDNQFLKYVAGAANKWVNSEINLNSNVNDVTINSIQNDDILIYNNTNTKYANSQRFKILETNYNTNFPTLSSQILNVDVVSPTTYTLNYDNALQTSFGLVKSTYTSLTVIKPLNNLGNDGTGDAAFLNVPATGGAASGYFAPYTQTVKADFFKLTGWGVVGDAVVRTTNDWIQNLNGGLNVNYSNNPLTAGTTYKLCCVFGLAAGAATRFRVWGLKTAGMAAGQMNTFTEPTAGTDWEQLLDDSFPIIATAGTSSSLDFTPANQIFLVRIFQVTASWRFWGGQAIMSSTVVTHTDTLKVPSDITVVPSSNGLVITNLNQGKVNESWKLSLSNCISYYVSQTVSKVIRGINSIYLSATQYSDSWIRVTNTNNDFKIENSTGTQNYITCNGSMGLIVPLNRSNVFWFDSDATPYNGADYQLIINALATQYQVLPTIISNTQFGSTSFVLNGGNEIMCGASGTYHITCTIVCQVNDANELYFRLGKTNANFLQGAVAVSACNNEYRTITLQTITTYTANEFLRLYISKIVGALPKTIQVYYYTITVTNMLNS